MNKDQVKGTIDDVAGRAKRQVGEWTGDTNAQVEGLGQQVKGKAEKAWGTAKEAAQEGHQQLKEQAGKAWDKTKVAVQDGKGQVKGTAKHAWDDTKAPGAQAQGVKSDFDGQAGRLRSIADSPKTAKLEGYIKIRSNWAIVRIFCFQKAQSDGKDWFAIDSSYESPSSEQDGTAHGDPP